ncbi:MAG: PIG-L family deacetylase [Anaerolineae bacterium]|nr:MAG: PIG-L family deacetylase [Anaerolineae bacterium]
MRSIVFSPHLDDAVFSCGGFLWQQAQAGRKVEVWTLCAGDPPDEAYSPFARTLHARWGLEGAAVVAVRRSEDWAACQLLGAVARHLELPDCIYRRGPAGASLYASEEAIFGSLHPADGARAADLARSLAQELTPEDQVYCPLTVGNHVDHQLTRRLVESLARPVIYFADVPYALRPEATAAALVPSGATAFIESVSAAALEKWVKASFAYASQVNSFWQDEAALHAALASFLHNTGGFPMWRTDK